MPTIHNENGFRVYFYSHEPNEPPHVHVDKAEASCKIWLQPIVLAKNLGFAAKELGPILNMIRLHQSAFLETWYGYFGDSRR
jgi:hypothetical protein